MKTKRLATDQHLNQCSEVYAPASGYRALTHLT